MGGFAVLLHQSTTTEIPTMTIAILTQAQVAAGLPALRKSAEELTANIHQYAVSTLDHAREFGDYRGCLALLNALPKSQRVQGLAAWYREFSTNKISLKLVEGSWIGEIRKDRTDGDFRMNEAAETTYADFTKEAAPKALTMAKFLASIEKVANNVETLPSGADKVPHEVKALAAQMIAMVRAA